MASRLVNVLALAALACSRPPPPPANVVLVTVDSLRADHLGCYGYAAKTPAIDALAEGGIRFARAVAQAPWTLPSVASILTSLYPSQHGADSVKRSLAPDVETLPERLAAAGYHTIGVVSHVFTGRRYGMAQGFEVFDETHVLGHQGVSSRLLTETALAQLGPRPREPFFLWVHYFDPHFDYIRHADFKRAPPDVFGLGQELSAPQLEHLGFVSPSQLAYIRGVYDEEIAFTDHWIGELWSGVESAKRRQPTVVILTADHGEYFLERGRFFHGRDAYGPLVNVPLIVAGDIDPSLRGRVIEEPVETAEIPATVAALAGLAPGDLHGRNLLDVAAGRSQPAACFVEASHANGPDDRKRAVVLGDWKLIRHLDSDASELYQTRADPEERHDLAASTDPEALEARARLERAMREFEASHAARASDPAGSLDLDADENEHLRSLGYVE